MAYKMTALLKKISAFFLLLTGAIPLLFTLFFLVKQQMIRYEMKEKLEKEFLHTITVPREEVTWVKYNKEIIVGNKLFDVKSFSEKNGLYFFTGLFDAEETALNDLLEKDTDDKNENELLGQLFQCLQTPCINVSFDRGIIANQNNPYSFPIVPHISSPFINIPTPPPQVPSRI